MLAILQGDKTKNNGGGIDKNHFLLPSASCSRIYLSSSESCKYFMLKNVEQIAVLLSRYCKKSSD